MTNKKNHDEYFDDCPVCRATEKAEERGVNLSLEEIKDAFKEAKQQGAMVGGSLFDEESN